MQTILGWTPKVFGDVTIKLIDELTKKETFINYLYILYIQWKH